MAENDAAGGPGSRGAGDAGRRDGETAPEAEARSVPAGRPEATEPIEPRGVRNPRIVDLIRLDRERGEVVLEALEDRPWGSEPDQLDQLDEKLSNYFTYVLDGHLTRDYPRYRNLPVRILLVCAAGPGEREALGFQRVADFADANGLAFEIRVVADPFARKAPWEEETKA